jgi:hypothetical protein
MTKAIITGVHHNKYGELVYTAHITEGNNFYIKRITENGETNAIYSEYADGHYSYVGDDFIIDWNGF